VRNGEVLLSVKDRYILHAIRIRKVNWAGHILRRNCLLKQVVEVKAEGRIGVTGRRVRRHKQLLEEIEERREYWKFKREH